MFEFIHNWILLKYHKIETGKNLKIEGKVNFFGKNIKIGDNVIIRSGKKYNPIDGGTYTCICTFGEGVIKIGNNVGISNSQICAAERIIIEDDVLIGGNTKIFDTDFHPINANKRKQCDLDSIGKKTVIIKRGAFIGASSIILKGVIVGENSIVGAGSVVTKNIPQGEIWAGNPAKFVKKVD